MLRSVIVARTATAREQILQFIRESVGPGNCLIPSMTNSGSKSAERIRTEKLQSRTFVFAKQVLDICPRRYSDDPSRILWRQLVRAAPSASGNLDEADEASSANDFVYKMKVVLRETKESRRWLRFIRDCKLQNHEQLGGLADEARQLCAIFATIVRNVERRLEGAAGTGRRRRVSQAAEQRTDPE